MGVCQTLLLDLNSVLSLQGVSPILSIPSSLPPARFPSICVYLVNLIRRLENPGESLTHLCLRANCKHTTTGNIVEEFVNQVQKTTLNLAISQNRLTVCDILFWLPDLSHMQSAKKKISKQMALLKVSYHNNRHSFIGLDVERTINLIIYISCTITLSDFFFFYKRGQQNERLLVPAKGLSVGLQSRFLIRVNPVRINGEMAQLSCG